MPAIFPTGVIIDAAAVALGGLTGAMVGPHIKNDMKDGLNLIFGVSSMAMGIGSIVLMQNLPAVIFSIIIGTTVGLILQLGRRLEAVGGKLQKALDRGKEKSQDTAALVTAIVLFCASGTGIYGSIVSGMSGDHTALFTANGF